MTQLSIQQYAEKLGITRQAVLYRINNGLPLPGVKTYSQVGRSYILNFNDNTDIEKAKKIFNNYPK